MVEKKNTIRRPSKVRNVSISIKITRHLSEWLSQENISPTASFMEAVKDMGYKPEIRLETKEQKISKEVNKLSKKK